VNTSVESILQPHVLDELLTTLDVRLHAFALCRIEDGFRLTFEPMEAVVVHYVLRGEGMLHQEGYDSVPFGPNHMLIVAPMRSQSLSSGLVTRTVAATDVCGLLSDGLLSLNANEGGEDLVVVCGTITATYGGGFGLFDHQAGPLIEDCRKSPVLAAAFDLLLRELAEPRMGSRALTEALMKQCLILVLRDQSADANAPSPILLALKEPRLAGAIRAILARPGAPHTLESLAGEAGMSRSVFAERFFAAYGQTPFEFVQTARLRSAARLLTISDMPVKAIARSVGYASRSHFSRAFRAAFKMDPSTYRRRRAANDELERPMLRTPNGDGAS
jgi:AraC-like DNA-binding protein